MKENEEKKPDEKVELHKEVDLKELGNTLPLMRSGPDGKLFDNQQFTFLTWDMETEERIAEHKEENKSVGGLVSKILIELLDQINGINFQELDDGKKALLINQMEFSNVLYMYIYLRVEELGTELKIPITCPTCNHDMPNFVVDLNTFEIHAKEKNHPLEAKYEMHRPIMLDKDVMVTAVNLRHSLWDAMESANLESAGNDAKMKKLLIKTSLHGFLGEDGPIEKFYNVDDFIKQLGKRDIEGLSRAIQDHNCGPLMALEGKCTLCRKKWFRLLDWNYDFFFGSSSL